MPGFRWSLGNCLLVGAIVLGAASLSLAGPVQHRPACSQIQFRKEWRDLSVEDRLAYIQAVHCLHSTPSREPGGVASSRFEDFQATHIKLTERIHSVGQFLPWHRQQATLYNKALREECGYRGPEAYWDWTRDGDSPKPLVESPLFDPVTGFGGDGVPGTYTIPPDPYNQSFIPPTMKLAYRGCVMTGPFAADKWVLNLGPGRLVGPHCLPRGIGDAWKHSITSANVAKALEAGSYEEFRLVIDNFVNGIHGGGHVVIGGEMINTYSAGGDPLFYLHHSNLDRIWWLWQQADPDKRMYDLSGPTTKDGPTPVTLDFVLDFPALGPNVTVRELMDSSLEPNCFRY